MDDNVISKERVHEYFSPYKRLDPPWTIYEWVKTVLMTVFVLPFRILYMLLACGFLVLVAFVATIGVPTSQASESSASQDTGADFDYDKDPLFQPLSPWRKILLNIIFPVCRSILFVSLGVYHIKKDKVPFSEPVMRKQPPVPENAYVIVANHLGYIDILVLLSKFQGSFVAKGDLERAPIVGIVARSLQCMFVRKGQSLTTQLINRMTTTYRCHRTRESCPKCPACMSKLVIFPEGTTTNGSAMVTFRTGVFNAGLPVKPVCIQFPYKHFNLSWETIRFREHLFRTMTQVRNDVTCTELPVYVPSAEEQADARLYSINVQTEMARVLDQPISALNRKHKFLYHSYLLGKESNEMEVLEKARKLVETDDQLLYYKARNVDDLV